MSRILVGPAYRDVDDEFEYWLQLEEERKMNLPNILEAAIEANENADFLSWYTVISSQNKRLLEIELHKVITLFVGMYQQLPDEVKQDDYRLDFLPPD